MQLIILAGAAVSLLGVAGLLYCVFRAWKARRSGQSDDVMRAELRRIVILNTMALGVSALGLMLVVLGILLG